MSVGDGSAGRGHLAAGGLVRPMRPERECEAEDCSPAVGAVHRQTSTVAARDLRGNPQAEAVAGGTLRGNERLEDLLPLVGGYAGSVVLDLDHRVAFGPDRAQSDPGTGLALHGVRRVDDEIH